MGSSKDTRAEQWEDCVLSAAAAIGGEAASKLWIDIPIPDLDGLSPRELLRCDRAAEVFDYLSTLPMYMPAAFPDWNASER
jgi:hypothetical protein